MIIFTVQHAAEISGVVNILDRLIYEDIGFWCGPEGTVREFSD
jgi:hypothetical protein